MMHDPLGDRMKVYESASDVRLDTSLPIVARIDGRGFHNWTKGLERPFDRDFSFCMYEAASALMEETGACMGYTQSDEITLAWHAEPGSQIWFGGRWSKMTSQLAAQATIHFYRHAVNKMPKHALYPPTFDARVWNVPSRAEGANVFLWREMDCIRNSVQAVAHHEFGHAQTMGKSSEQKVEMLRAVGIDWHNTPPAWQRGLYFQRVTIQDRFTAEEIEALPPLHHARKNPDLVVERSRIDRRILPPMRTIANKEAVIFEGAQLVIREEKAA